MISPTIIKHGDPLIRIPLWMANEAKRNINFRDFLDSIGIRDVNSVQDTRDTTCFHMPPQ